MIALLQRVRSARVEVAAQVVGSIGTGVLAFVCAEPSDTEALADRLVEKILKLRIFADDAGKMNRSVVDVAGGLLIVSQFTLAADTTAGNRPALRPPRRPRSDCVSTNASSRRRAAGIHRWRRASSAPTCRCTSSTTAR